MWTENRKVLLDCKSERKVLEVKLFHVNRTVCDVTCPIICDNNKSSNKWAQEPMTTAHQTCLWLTLKKKKVLLHAACTNNVWANPRLHFCLISIGLSLSDDANKMKFLNIESA